MKIIKKITAVAVWVLAIGMLCSCNFDVIDNTEAADKGLSVQFIDVGQGDSALIKCGGEVMLIDGGKAKASDIIYTCLKQDNTDVIDYMVCTHADDDHIGGLPAAFSAAKVRNVIAPYAKADTRAFEKLQKAIYENDVTVRHPKNGENMALGDAKVYFYGPISESEEDRNNSSIVLKIVYGKTSFLFTGDAERSEEKEILDAGYDISATVLKVGHHGSKNSTTYPFLREVMPKYAVISVGKDNSYGHPTEDVLSRLRDAGAQVYRTDMQGDIFMVSDGKNVSVSVQKNASAKTNSTEK